MGPILVLLRLVSLIQVHTLSCGYILCRLITPGGFWVWLLILIFPSSFPFCTYIPLSFPRAANTDAQIQMYTSLSELAVML